MLSLKGGCVALYATLVRSGFRSGGRGGDETEIETRGRAFAVPKISWSVVDGSGPHMVEEHTAQ